VFLQGDGEGRLGELNAKQLAGHDRHAVVEDACEDGVTDAVQRLVREQGLDDETGVQRDRVGQQKLVVLDREDTTGDDRPA
jgi:hypothetical protein